MIRSAGADLAPAWADFADGIHLILASRPLGNNEIHRNYMYNIELHREGLSEGQAQPSFTAVPEALTISMLPSLPTTS